MSFLPADRLPSAPQTLALTKDARATLDAYEAFLAHPAFVHNVDLAVLVKLATADGVTDREKRRAAEILLTSRLQARRDLAGLTCVKEQILDQLGIAASSPGSVHVTQVQQVTKIEVVREKDWRDAATSDERG